MCNLSALQMSAQLVRLYSRSINIECPIHTPSAGLRVRVRGDPEPAVLPVPLPEAGAGAGVAGGAALHAEHLAGVVEGGAQVHLRARNQQGRPQGRGHRGHSGTQAP